ncbi:hypothetical protein SAMN02746062_01005 [Alysiella filiformis DSM 16848]|uniref:Uncharacterized protein n=1 Tax=Alysiella filiformis DSM 16848 TaxID=1120981 RepID=A0A286E9X9_9NEIS|nr:hypothetical protein SAMN02746062_01005 [Alysiella filiformis DSM 16848]
MLIAAVILFILNIIEFCIKIKKSFADNVENTNNIAKFSNQNAVAKNSIKNIIKGVILVFFIMLPVALSMLIVISVISERFFKKNDIKNNSDVSYVNEHRYVNDYELNYSNKNFRVVYPNYTCILPFEIQEVWKNNLSYEIAEELENQILPDEKARTLQHKRMAEHIQEIKNQAISSGVSVEIGNLIITCQPEMPKEQDNKQK